MRLLFDRRNNLYDITILVGWLRISCTMKSIPYLIELTPEVQTHQIIFLLNESTYFWIKSTSQWFLCSTSCPLSQLVKHFFSSFETLSFIALPRDSFLWKNNSHIFIFRTKWSKICKKLRILWIFVYSGPSK